MNDGPHLHQNDDHTHSTPSVGDKSPPVYNPFSGVEERSPVATVNTANPLTEDMLASRSSRLWAHIIDQLFFILPVLVTDSIIPGLMFLFVISITTGLWGQSPGKNLLRIKIVRFDLTPAGFVHGVLLRLWVFVGASEALDLFVPGMPWLLGLFGFLDSVAIFGDDRRCLHDHLADTIVVRVGVIKQEEDLRKRDSLTWSFRGTF